MGAKGAQQAEVRTRVPALTADRPGLCGPRVASAPPGGGGGHRARGGRQRRRGPNEVFSLSGNEMFCKMKQKEN